MNSRALFSFPALIIAIALAIAFFFVRARLTRPDVPTPVAATIEHFAPGVAIGTSIDHSAKKVAGLRWVDNVGFIGRPAATMFDEVRLIPERPASGALVSDRESK